MITAMVMIVVGIVIFRSSHYDHDGHADDIYDGVSDDDGCKDNSDNSEAITSKHRKPTPFI